MKLQMKRWLQTIAAGVLLLVGGAAHAVTPPGTIINNVARVTYTMPSLASTFTVNSTIATFQVLELVDARVQWTDTSAVIVSSPDTYKPLTFKVFNLGNAAHSFVLTTATLPGGQAKATPSTPALYVENGLQSGLQLTGPNADLSLANGSVVDFAAQEVKTVYAVSDIATGAAFNAQGAITLTARSALTSIQGAAPGTQLSGVGTSGLDVVVGHFGGSAKDDGGYIVQGAIVSTNKRVAGVVDTTGGSKAGSGSVVTYEVSIVAQGTGHLSDVTITDPLPAQTEYVASSLLLDGVALPDAGRVSGNTITVVVGAKTAPFTSTLQFKARIR